MKVWTINDEHQLVNVSKSYKEEISVAPRPRVRSDRLRKSPDTSQYCRIRSLPRALHLGIDDSDRAREIAILNAKRTLKICQQDLVFEHMWSSSNTPDSHRSCELIAKALIKNDQLEVQVVISPRFAGGAGEPYSWGAGAHGTHAMIVHFLEKQGKKTAAILRRLHVAPFAFTHDVLSDNDYGTWAMQDGQSYQWPSAKKDTMYYEQGDVLPKGMSASKCIPAPGNHAKFYLVDDTACYVGSDNMYPHTLIEFGYLVEGNALMQDVLTNYWNQVWNYSKHACIGHRGDQRESCQDLPEVFVRGLKLAPSPPLSGGGRR
jgi:hypothetical protein